MPCSTDIPLASNTRSSTYLTVRFTFPYVLKSPKIPRDSLLSYLMCMLDILTYLLHGTESFLGSLMVKFAANQEIPRILWNPKVHYPTHKRPPPVRILSQLHPVPPTPSHFLKIHLNIILPSKSWSPKWSIFSTLLLPRPS